MNVWRPNKGWADNFTNKKKTMFLDKDKMLILLGTENYGRGQSLSWAVERKIDIASMIKAIDQVHTYTINT